VQSPTHSAPSGPAQYVVPVLVLAQKGLQIFSDDSSLGPDLISSPKPPKGQCVPNIQCNFDPKHVFSSSTWEAILSRFYGLNYESIVLDLAPGYGHLLLACAQNGFRYLGFETSTPVAKAMSQNAVLEKLIIANLQASDFRNLPLPVDFEWIKKSTNEKENSSIKKKPNNRKIEKDDSDDVQIVEKSK